MTLQAITSYQCSCGRQSGPQPQRRSKLRAGKNPYGELDVLGSMPQSQLGEWESMMNVSGYHGMPSFKVRLALSSTVHSADSTLTLVAAG